MIVSIDPATEEVLARFEEDSDERIESALADAQRAFEIWRAASFADRATGLRRLAGVLRRESERYARLITLEMGKPITEARAEIEKCAVGCEHFADNLDRYLADEPIATAAARSFVAYAPLGVVLAIMPWNYPFWQVIRFAAPAIAAGNAAVLKHASNVPQCALAVQEAFAAAGLPAGLLRTVLIEGARVERLIGDGRVRAVTLTGSSATGERVAALAGRALKKSVLELGGSDPFIVLGDADIAAAAATAARARMQNAGQSCIAAKRFLVEASVAREFEELFADAVRALRVGDPQDPATQIGPLARADLRDALDEQVRQSVQAGARVVTGGHRRAGRGWFYEPTILADVTPEMPVLRDETFGPVAALYRVSDAEEAVRVANSSPYGLGASLWTRDHALGVALARRLESGSVFINGMVASDPRLPFGGVKRSGYGRELSAFGIREFTNVQTIWSATGAGPPSAAAE